jgi:hypothetical protein
VLASCECCKGIEQQNVNVSTCKWHQVTATLHMTAKNMYVTRVNPLHTICCNIKKRPHDGYLVYNLSSWPAKCCIRASFECCDGVCQQRLFNALLVLMSDETDCVQGKQLISSWKFVLSLQQHYVSKGNCCVGLQGNNLHLGSKTLLLLMGKQIVLHFQLWTTSCFAFCKWVEL